MRTEITPGQDSDHTGYDPVMADNLPQPAVLVADRGYDPDRIREDIESRNALSMIPMRRHRKLRKAVDITICTLRNMGERCFSKLKNSRRLRHQPGGRDMSPKGDEPVSKAGPGVPSRTGRQSG